MKIAIASGKGGTGKTTVATSLALSLTPKYLNGSPLLSNPLFKRPVTFLDCDVEAPNAHLFLRPEIELEEDASLLIPNVDQNICTYCGTCAEVCQFNAIAVVGRNVMVFPQLCHACGSCTMNCPESAITEVPKAVGKLMSGSASEGIVFAQGLLNVGEPMAVPVISRLKDKVSEHADRVVILDAPPGSSCPVVEVMRGSDFVLLVTEPTPFGLHDLRLAVEVARLLNLPLGVVINRDGMGDDQVDRFCKENDVPVLMRIPFERKIAEGIARGQSLIDIYPELAKEFQNVFEKILVRCG